MFGYMGETSNQQLLDGELELLDLVFQLAAFVGSDACRNNRPGHAAGSPQSSLRGHKDVGHILQSGVKYRGVDG